MLNFLKKSFITGLVLTLPLGITFFFVDVLLNYVGEPASNILFCWLDLNVKDVFWMKVTINTISIALVALIIVLIGALSKLFFGKFVINCTEKIISKLPFVRTVYKTVKQVIETFGNTQQAAFSKTVLIEYPKKDCYAVGFLASEAQGEVQDKTGQMVVNVFVPTTPNPTSGFLLMVPKSDVVELDMSISEGIKLIISGGIVVPPYKKLKKG